MEVTKKNFKQLLPEILASIDSSDFLSIDGEFTGLSNGHNITSFDTPSQYYSKIRTGALDFLFVQFGLSIFKQTGSYKFDNTTYVFYLFPNPSNKDAPDCRFLCQASSLGFLAQNNFDFNKVFKDGIPYLTHDNEGAMREAMADRAKYKAANSSSPISNIAIPKLQKPQVDSAMKKIKELLDPTCTVNEITVEKCSPFVRKLVYQTVRTELEGKDITVETNNGILIARRGVSKEQLDIEKADRDEDEIQNAIGFSLIIRHIVASGKLIVGHNILLDLCHIVHRFLAELPNEYEEFKDMLHNAFPKILDTKFLASQSTFNELIVGSALANVMEAINKEPFKLPQIEFSEEYGYSTTSGQLHDAGYDAYITGIAFLTLLKHLGKKPITYGVHLHIFLEKNEESKEIIESEELQKHINKLFLMRTPDTFINLADKDPEPSRDHVFHITFPKSWTTQNIVELFSPFGSIQISWLTCTTAWVGLHNRGMAFKAKSSLQNRAKKCSGVSVKSYAKFSSGSGVTVPASPRPNKRKSSTGNEVKQLPGGDLRNTKKRKSAIVEPRVETILEEFEDINQGSEAARKLETASKCSTASNFPVDEDWN